VHTQTLTPADGLIPRWALCSRFPLAQRTRQTNERHFKDAVPAVAASVLPLSSVWDSAERRGDMGSRMEGCIQLFGTKNA
jgi:hypothetical protein